MYQGATERYIKNGPVLSGNSAPLNFMSTHVWEEERKRKEEKKEVCIRYFYVPSLFLECLTVQNVMTFQFVSPFFSPFQEIFPVLDDLSLFFSLSSFILDDLVANIFRLSNLDLQRANRM